jgi:hypothetical protein
VPPDRSEVHSRPSKTRFAFLNSDSNVQTVRLNVDVGALEVDKALRWNVSAKFRGVGR